MIRSQNRNPGIGRYATCQPLPNALRHVRQFGKGNALDGLSALNFKRHIVGKLSGRFLKTLIERGHGSEVNILKRANEN